MLLKAVKILLSSKTEKEYFRSIYLFENLRLPHFHKGNYLIHNNHLTLFCQAIGRAFINSAFNRKDCFVDL